MTEINVQKKKGSIWPWIILGLIVLAIILYFVFRNDNNNNTATSNATDTTAAMTTANTDTAQQNDGAVASYIAYVKQDTAQMSQDHEYSSNALNKLIDAVQAKADAVGYDVKANLDKARADANEITQNPDATNHAEKIKDAADVISKALQQLQQAKYTSLNSEANDVKNAADAIKPNVLTLNQKDAVQSFFDKAADMLQKMQ